MTTEQKALALVNEVTDSRADDIDDFSPSELRLALYRAIEAHEADKKAFSDAVKKAIDFLNQGRLFELGQTLSPFIKPEPDPLVEAHRQIADRVLRQFGAPASDEDCIGLIVAALEEQAKEADNG